MLREDGFCVEIAADGPEAMTRLSSDPAPDVLVTNVHVGRADGTDLTRFARSRRPNMQVLYVTEHPHLLARDAKEEVLTKPLEYSALMALLAAGPA